MSLRCPRFQHRSGAMLFAPTALLIVLAVLPGPVAATVAEPRVFGKPPTGEALQTLRRYIHETAREEQVDAFELDALPRLESNYVNALGAAGELSPFQIMPDQAKRLFQLPDASYLWDIRVSTRVAARLWRHGLSLWRAEFAAAGSNTCLRRAGWKGPLTQAAFGAMVWNYGRTAAILRHAANLRLARLPTSVCEYAVRFERSLREVRRLGAP